MKISSEGRSGGRVLTDRAIAVTRSLAPRTLISPDAPVGACSPTEQRRHLLAGSAHLNIPRRSGGRVLTDRATAHTVGERAQDTTLRVWGRLVTNLSTRIAGCGL
jgi:hypothetical protein